MANSIFDNEETNAYGDEERKKPPEAELFAPSSYTVVSTEETVRRSGLAWSAGIVFFSATAFMMFLGWGADLLLGSAPWGLVVGIVLGSTIGFVQFARLTSQMYRPGSDKNAIKPLLPRDDDK